MAQSIHVQPAAQNQLFGPLSKNFLISQLQPYDNRHCTDICCLIIGTIFSLAVIGIPLYFVQPWRMEEGNVGWRNVAALNFPSDTQGKICGYDYPQHQYVYFANAPEIDQRICLKSCPSSASDPLQCPQQTPSCPSTSVPSYPSSSTPFSGKFCLPQHHTTRHNLLQSHSQQNKFFFLKEYPQYHLRLAVAVAIAVVVMVLMQCCPGTTLHFVLFVSMIAELAMGVAFYVYQTQTILEKAIVAGILLIIFIFTAIQLSLYKDSLKMTKIFLSQSKIFVNNHCCALYIFTFLFVIAQSIFIVWVFALYTLGLASFPGHQDLKSQLYQQPDKTCFIVTVSVLGVYALWGFYCIRQTFNFIVSTYCMYQFYRVQDHCSPLTLAIKLLLFKHPGSIMASAFVNAFFLFPAAVYDNLRSCNGNKFYNSGCIGSMLDLVRPDAIAYLVLTGNPYCTSAKYCEYLWFQSMTTQMIKSPMRIYKIASQIGVSTSAAIASLFIFIDHDILEARMLYFTLVIGTILAAFFTGLHTDVCQNVRLIYLVEEESFKRRIQGFKYTTSSLNKSDQIRFLKQAYLMYSNKTVAEEIVKTKMEFWKLQPEEDINTKKTKKGKKKAQPTA